MKKSIISLLYIIGVQPLYAQSTQNYIKSQERNANGELVTSYQYFDGAGRPFERVGVGTGGSGSNLVWLTEYDGLGRQSRQWLPLSTGSAFVEPATVRSSVSNARSDSRAFDETGYESSPLDRVVRRQEPGQIWTNHPQTTAYLHNTSAFPLCCKDYGVSISGSLTSNGLYAENTLTVTLLTDENGNKTYEFRDVQNRLLLERRMLDNSSSADTYYCYDYRGDLCYVLQPEYQTSGSLSQHAFQYKYDARHNVIEKQLPSVDAVKYAYDRANRLSYSQDGNQRASGLMSFMLYDIHGRLLLKGECSGSALPNVSSSFIYVSKGTSGGIGNSGYTGSQSLSGAQVHEAHYYDDYSFKTASLGYVNSAFTSGTVSAKGLETGSRLATLGSTPTSLYTVNHYDIRGRGTKRVSTNHLSGTETRLTTYGYTELPTAVTHTHTASGKATQTEQITYAYDKADRLVSVSHKLNGNPQVTLQSNTYDQYGRLQKRSLMGQEQVTYALNIRNWPTSISSTNFFESLGYHDGQTPQFNGNVSRQTWRAGTESNTRTYNFGYDALDRLTSASYTGTGNYATQYTYDLNGNFKTLKRNGLQDGGTYGLIDNLTFTLNGNQVTRIDDAVTDPTYNGVFNFMDGANQPNEYLYDKNGNQTKDLNKKILSIQNNSLNLPTSIEYSNGKSATYTYDADGRKLRTSHKMSSTSATTTTDYCGNMVYENNVLKQILVEGGYVTFSGTTPAYHYYLQDHLGNNRVVANASGAVEQVNHYYPFGGLMAESSGGDTQRYKYGSKELDRMHGLDWYDFGARHYDGMRFTAIDKMAETTPSVSPYIYSGNNPIRYNDPNGNTKRDQILGYLIGGVTNIVPGTSKLRDEYSPTDPADYNCALRSADETAMSVGAAMLVLGGSAAVVGGTAAEGGVGVTLATGGAAAEVAVPVAVAGEALQVAGTLVAVGGMMMMSNSKNNQEAGSNSRNSGQSSNSGRGKNRLGPNKEADGDHSTFKRDTDGSITNTATYRRNSKNPNGWQEEKRVDRVGASHGNVPTPHVHENGKVRPARPDEL